ncbi:MULTISPECIES: VC0807 family protein [Glycomyces]|uniref:Membrane protein n=2 Tax=Glycomyces TaxID=58113 RepID=A0A9X3PL58_9ACTN|nr:VC0807 family protein [Glycomyces lechevalierae]MDA1385939.1 hypothetical protein [Glycomyces lechevalierae]MDR7340904.1 putative membrane protein [Glycomyces lechevalierae]
MNSVRDEPGVKDGMRALLRRNAATVLFDLVLPMAVYYGLRAAGVGQWWAMMAGILVVVPRVAHQLLTRRRFDVMAVFTLSVIVFSLVIGLLTDDPRALAVREGWVGSLLGLFGAWMIVSVGIGRPALMVLGRGIAETKTGEAGAAKWAARWDHDRAFRHGIRVLTAVWGVLLLAAAAVNLVLIYTLPVDLIAAVSNGAYWAILAAALAFHLYYTKKVDLRA